MIKCPEKKCSYNKNGECKNKENLKKYEEKAYAIVKKCKEYKES